MLHLVSGQKIQRNSANYRRIFFRFLNFLKTKNLSTPCPPPKPVRVKKTKKRVRKKYKFWTWSFNIALILVNQFLDIQFYLLIYVTSSLLSLVIHQYLAASIVRFLRNGWKCNVLLVSITYTRDSVFKALKNECPDQMWEAKASLVWWHLNKIREIWTSSNCCTESNKLEVYINIFSSTIFSNNFFTTETFRRKQRQVIWNRRLLG